MKGGHSPWEKGLCCHISVSTALIFCEVWVWFHLTWKWGLPQPKKRICIIYFLFFQVVQIKICGGVKNCCSQKPHSNLQAHIRWKDTWLICSKSRKMLLLLQGIAQKAMRRWEFWFLNQQFPKVYFHLWFSQVKAKLFGSTGKLVAVGEKHRAGISLMPWNRG